MNKILLKNPLAQKLLEHKKVIINGIEINLWTGHSHNSVRIQESWNQIKSYTSLNEQTDGSNGDIVITGVMQIPRNEIAEYAIKLGFKVHTNVSHNTDYLLIGSENVSPSKLADVIRLNENGANIQILDEVSFLQVVSDNYDIIESINLEDININDEDFHIEKKKKKSASKKIKKRTTSKKQIISTALSGKSLIISGVFNKHSREEIKELIEQHGGKNVSSISAKTDYLVAGEKIGPGKREKAQKLNIPIISEDEFLTLIGNQ